MHKSMRLKHEPSSDPSPPSDPPPFPYALTPYSSRCIQGRGARGEGGGHPCGIAVEHWGSEFRISGSGFRVDGFRFRVKVDCGGWMDLGLGLPE